jgi:hypothetical protein
MNNLSSKNGNLSGKNANLSSKNGNLSSKIGEGKATIEVLQSLPEASKKNKAPKPGAIFVSFAYLKV